MKSILFILVIIAFVVVYKIVTSLFGKNVGYGTAPNSLRFLAWFYDIMLIHIILFLGAMGYYFIREVFKEKVVGYISYIVNEVGYGQLRSDWLKLEIKLLLVYVLYSFVFEAMSKKGTIGKQALRITFEQELGVVNALVRNLVKAISLVFFPLFLILSRLNTNRFWLHDLFFKVKITKMG